MDDGSADDGGADDSGADDGRGGRIPGRHVTELTDFFAAHDRWLFGHACARTRGDRELAADLVQDTFEAAARAWDMLREHAGGRQRAWLLSTLAHKDISALRHREAFRRRQPDIQARYQPTAADTEAAALNAIALARAREIIEDLPPRQREIALLRWQDHLRIAEIAARLGVAEGTVHASLHAARRKLVAGLERYHPSGEGAAS
jgi:RNA polymerase sigma factor (sigma-70 family)